MARKKKEFEIFSLSFLDCVCCGFGAIILLFVLSKAAEPIIIEEVREDLSGLIKKLEKEVYELRGEVAVLNRDLKGKQEQLSEEKEKIARLQGDLSEVKGEFEASKTLSSVHNTIEGKLAAAKQRLTEEMRRLMAQQREQQEQKDRPIGGIPVDSEYIIFVIDTSGSMKRPPTWGMVVKKLDETLKIYPQVKGIQVLNDMGGYMFPQYRGRWIPDSPKRRQIILNNLATWVSGSNSSPVEGIQTAIHDFYEPDKKISIYVFGDEFSGRNTRGVVQMIDRMNRETDKGERMVRIHGVGFPSVVGQYYTGTQFATLMRILCQRNGGTFVGLNSVSP